MIYIIELLTIIITRCRWDVKEQKKTKRKDKISNG